MVLRIGLGNAYSRPQRNVGKTSPPVPNPRCSQHDENAPGISYDRTSHSARHDANLLTDKTKGVNDRCDKFAQAWTFCCETRAMFRHYPVPKHVPTNLTASAATAEKKPLRFLTSHSRKQPEPGLTLRIVLLCRPYLSRATQRRSSTGSCRIKASFPSAHEPPQRRGRKGLSRKLLETWSISVSSIPHFPQYSASLFPEGHQTC